MFLRKNRMNCIHGTCSDSIGTSAWSFILHYASGGFVITKPVGLVSPPLCFRVCLSFTCYYLFSLFGRTEWPRQSRPSRPIELWHNRCNTSMHLSQEPLIRPSCSFHQFAPAPVGFLGGMGLRQRGLLYCMWITLNTPSTPTPPVHPPPRPTPPPCQWAPCPWKPPALTTALFAGQPAATHVRGVRQHQMLIFPRMSIIKNTPPFSIWNKLHSFRRTGGRTLMPVCRHVYRIVHDNMCTVMTLHHKCCGKKKKKGLDVMNTARHPVAAVRSTAKHAVMSCWLWYC